MPDTPDEELVRRLLADARHDEPVPADVVARLDGVLDELAGERGQPGRAVARRRPAAARRWVAGLAAAAAVVVVGGIAVQSLRPDGSGGGSSSSTAADSGGKAAGSSSGSVEPQSPSAGALAIFALHRETLEADVRRTARRVQRSPAAIAGPESSGTHPLEGVSGCAVAQPGAGQAVPASLDGAPALLMLRPPERGRQVADVLECGSGRVLASVTVPAR